MTLYLFLRGLLAPPGLQLLLVVAGLWARARHFRRLGAGLVTLGLFWLYLMATPLGAMWLAAPLAQDPPLPLERRAWQGAEAIVVLGGGRGPAAEFGGVDMPGYWTQSRLRYAAWLARRTGLPLAVSGGVVANEPEPEAAVMARSLQQDYGVGVRWQEARSGTTWENARESRALLSRDGITRVILVTQSMHMRRARLAFEHAGFTVVPAPVDFVSDGAERRPLLLRLTPVPAAFMTSSQALHEYAGLVAYRVRIALE
ncbi:MAG TPA: YdcF family protein [Moraxellaceae bacterium]|nr:YdcF family protein [Moraxellaceae bacterium]